MRRRTILKAAAGTPILGSNAAVAKESKVVYRVSESYFRSLPETKPERNEAVIDCANHLCQAKKVISKGSIDAAVEAGETAEDVVRRVRFGVRILNEYNMTNTVDESLIARGEEKMKKATAYIPLLGSFNELLKSACAVEYPEPEPGQVKDFLYASLAFGIEVALWSIGVPYKMAWRGTRFVSNRTLLRFAKYGCRGCVAIAMSEIHWAIRASVYNHGVTENRVKFVAGRIRELKHFAETVNYEVDLEFSEEEIRSTLNKQENRSLFDQLTPDLPDPNGVLDWVWNE